MSIVDLVQTAWETYHVAISAGVGVGAGVVGTYGVINFVRQREQLQGAQYQVIKPGRRRKSVLPGASQENEEDKGYSRETSPISRL